ncbi:hypothetical protein KAR91_49935 [Candidatus Pacearchaeota archaeon]|nr:hypothetical protein [Candidatus Pacearchaeota archaeon]
MNQLTESNIQRALILDYQKDLVIANHYPLHWFECDFLRITNANYMYEYEIKLSRSDFHADKRKESCFRIDGKTEYINKHNQLKNGSVLGPSRFFFVVPTDMIKVDEVPEFAGLVYASQANGRVNLMVVKQAPILHKTKWDKVKIKKLAKSYQWRYLTRCK